MIHKYPLLSCYTISDFEPHFDIKSELLELIEQTKSSSTVRHGMESIHSTDWYENVNEPRSYMDFLSPMLEEHMDKVCEDIGINMKQGYEFRNVWYNQYKKGDFSEWHRHIGTNWACVYYVDLETDQDGTVIRSPYDGTEIQTMVKEGQILTMPSHIYHKCAPTMGNKTIIGFNIS